MHENAFLMVKLTFLFLIGFVLFFISPSNEEIRRQLRIVHWDVQLSLQCSQLFIYLRLVATNGGINEIFRAWKQISICFAEEHETLQSPWIRPASPGNIMPNVWHDTIVWIQLKPRAWWSDQPPFDDIFTVSQFWDDANEESNAERQTVSKVKRHN